MNKKIYCILIILICFSCTNNAIDNSETYKNEWDRIKASKNLLETSIYIQDNLESPYLDSCLLFFLRLQNEYIDSIAPPPIHCGKNCIIVLVNTDGKILVDGKIVELDSISQLTYSHLKNKNNDEYSSEYKALEDQKMGQALFYSKGHIKVTLLPETIKQLRPVLIEIRKGIDKYKNDLALEWFQTSLTKATNAQKNLIDSLYSNRILLKGERLQPKPPPPNYQFNN